jgi:hypothetical protein
VTTRGRGYNAEQFSARPGASGVILPRQNRPLIRDGRLQARKKRTDRNYLRPGPAAAPAANAEAPDAPAPQAVSPAQEAPSAAPATRIVPAGRLPTAVRAIQQQGVRKRREIDLAALARRDTQYALHELRRILILTALVVTTLIVLGVVLR